MYIYHYAKTKEERYMQEQLPPVGAPAQGRPRDDVDDLIFRGDPQMTVSDR